MISVKKSLSLCLLFFISCGFHTDSGLLYPIPVLKVKLGETKTFHLKNYFRGEKVDLIIQNPAKHRLLIGNDLKIDGSLVSHEFETIFLLANGHPIQVIIKYEWMVKHTFSFSSESAGKVVVMGGFNDWSRTALPLEKIGTLFSQTIFMEPKKHEYKFVVDGVEEIDPSNPVFISNNIGGWNSILDLSHQTQTKSGQLIKKSQNGNWLTFDYVPPKDGAIPQEWIVLLNNSKLHADIVDPLPNGGIKVNIAGVDKGLLRIVGIDISGRLIPENQTIIKNGKPLSTESDDWHFSIIYNILVDRFLDGDPSNNKPIYDPKLPELANFMGGDFSGIQQKLDDGYFEDLGVNTLWISPIQKQPDSSWVEWVLPNRTFSGYHGYWPIEPKEIEPRFGNREEFKTIIKTSHKSETKVILDFVSNHVHQNHPYFMEHREWFGNVKLPDGRINIRQWDGDTRLTTWFDEFIPSFDFSSAPEALNQVVDDAMWWMKEYDLDGFRQDAVKHVPHSFWQQLTQAAKSQFPEKSIYQIGETFGSDDLIGSYVNPAELDAQFNFGIYFNARGPFSSDEANFSDLGRIIEENRNAFGSIHLMGNITSSHDQFRFAGYADGQMNFGDNGTARSFDNPVGGILHKSTYSKLANFHAFNISQPGIPIIYYGEEIAMMGEGDPGNRRMMRFNLSGNEKELKRTYSKLNRFRQNNSSLALGDQIILLSDGPILATLKCYFDEKILLVINNGPNSKNVEIKLPVKIHELLKIGEEIRIPIKTNNVIIKSDPYSFQFFHAL